MPDLGFVKIGMRSGVGGYTIWFTASGGQKLAGLSMNVADRLKAAFPNQALKADGLIAECEAMLRGLAHTKACGQNRFQVVVPDRSLHPSLALLANL